jgi:hypothetical protein
MGKHHAHIFHRHPVAPTSASQTWLVRARKSSMNYAGCVSFGKGRPLLVELLVGSPTPNTWRVAGVTAKLNFYCVQQNLS